MTGEFLYEPRQYDYHQCEPPLGSQADSIWRCQCGQHFLRKMHIFSEHPNYWKKISYRAAKKQIEIRKKVEADADRRAERKRRP